jgi:hypothetical protein
MAYLVTRMMCVCVVALSLSACTTTYWYHEDLVTKGKKSGFVELVQVKPPDTNLMAWIERKPAKTFDSRLDMLSSVLDEAKNIGAEQLYCPSTPADTTKLTGFGFPSPDDIKKAAEWMTQFFNGIKEFIALPFTIINDVRGLVLSDKVLICGAYKK